MHKLLLAALLVVTCAHSLAADEKTPPTITYITEWEGLFKETRQVSNSGGTNSPLALAQASSSAQQTETSQEALPRLTVYGNYKEALAASGGRLLSIDKNSRLYSGYSLLPFGSRNKAMAEAMSNAAKSPDLSFLVFEDRKQTFPAEAPPPGSFMGGVYYVYRVLPVRFVELTADNLLNEIKAHATTRISDISRQHIKALVDIAKDPAFRTLTSEYRNIVRGANDERFDGFALPSLIGLIELHEGKNCVDDLLRWAKFHKNPQARLGSYTALIALGKISEVEEILKSEENRAVKEAVKKALI